MSVGARERGRAEATELARSAAAAAADKKAQDIIELDLRGLVSYTDFFLICSGANERQTKAICEAIAESLAREHSVKPRRVEGRSQAQWILMDYGDLVIHIFTPALRDHYRLESLWGEAPARIVRDDEHSLEAR
jgi:ribosome-associated protein